MPPLEQFILHRLHELDGQVREAYADYRFQDVVRPVLEFCSGDLSALYFDIRKDSLYCDRPDAIRRRAARTVMDEVFMRLTAWLAPLTPFTMEEAWTTRFPEGGSNCARVIPETPDSWMNAEEKSRWFAIKYVRDTVNGALEIARRDKLIGSSLDADVTVTVLPFEDFPNVADKFSDLDSAEVFITSLATVSGVEVLEDGGFRSDDNRVRVEVLSVTNHPKCARSWRRVPDVGSDPAYPDLSARDADAVRFWDAARG